MQKKNQQRAAGIKVPLGRKRTVVAQTITYRDENGELKTRREVIRDPKRIQLLTGKGKRMNLGLLRHGRIMSVEEEKQNTENRKQKRKIREKSRRLKNNLNSSKLSTTLSTTTVFNDDQDENSRSSATPSVTMKLKTPINEIKEMNRTAVRNYTSTTTPAVKIKMKATVNGEEPKEEEGNQSANTAKTTASSKKRKRNNPQFSEKRYSGSSFCDALNDVIVDLCNHPKAEAFCVPNQTRTADSILLVVDYKEYVSDPIGLLAMKEKNGRGEYESRWDFLDDMLLLLDNSIAYNTQSVYGNRDLIYLADFLFEAACFKVMGRENNANFKSLEGDAESYEQHLNMKHRQMIEMLNKKLQRERERIILALDEENEDESDLVQPDIKRQCKRVVVKIPNEEVQFNDPFSIVPILDL